MFLLVAAVLLQNLHTCVMRLVYVCGRNLQVTRWILTTQRVITQSRLVRLNAALLYSVL